MKSLESFRKTAFKRHFQGIVFISLLEWNIQDRKLTLSNLIVIIINFKSSIQRKLDRFLKTISKSDFNIWEVTKGAFTQAGAKLNPFQRLNEVATTTFYNEAEYYTWQGMRVLAIDESRLV